MLYMELIAQALYMTFTYVIRSLRFTRLFVVLNVTFSFYFVSLSIDVFLLLVSFINFSINYVQMLYYNQLMKYDLNIDNIDL